MSLAKYKVDQTCPDWTDIKNWIFAAVTLIYDIGTQAWPRYCDDYFHTKN